MPLQPNGLYIDAVTPLHKKIHAIRLIADAISFFTSRMITAGSSPATLCKDLIEYCNRPIAKEYAQCLTSFFRELSHNDDHLLTLQALTEARDEDNRMNGRIGFFASRLEAALGVDLLNITELLYYSDNIDRIIETELNFFHSMGVDRVHDLLFEHARLYAHSSADIAHQMHLNSEFDDQNRRGIFFHTGQYRNLLIKAEFQLKKILGANEYAQKLRMVNEFLNHTQESEDVYRGEEPPQVLL
jgi:hypothetical protein